MVIVDASLAVKLFVVEVFTAQTISLAASWRIAGVELATPDFMPSEFATALRKKIQEGILTFAGAKELMGELYVYGIDIRPSRPLHDRAIDLAVELNQRLAYDSHYLALAESLDRDFWTAGRPFFRAAHRRCPRVQWIGNYNP